MVKTRVVQIDLTNGAISEWKQMIGNNSISNKKNRPKIAPLISLLRNCINLKNKGILVKIINIFIFNYFVDIKIFISFCSY